MFLRVYQYFMFFSIVQPKVQKTAGPRMCKTIMLQPQWWQHDSEETIA